MSVTSSRSARSMSFSGSSPDATVRALVPELREPLDDLWVDGEEVHEKSERTIAALQRRLEQGVPTSLSVTGSPAYVSLHDGIVKYIHRDPFAGAEDALRGLAEIPFEVCVHRDRWAIDKTSPLARKTNTPPLHYPAGWFIALRGKGQGRIVGERWLATTPCHVVRRGDLIVFFRYPDERMQAEEAVGPARESLSIGLIPTLEEIADDALAIASIGLSPVADERKLFYIPSTRTAEVVVFAEDPSERTLRWLTAVRMAGGLGPSPIEQVRVVFLEPERAERFVRGLWLRELQCVTFVDGREVDLTARYAPPSRSVV